MNENQTYIITYRFSLTETRVEKVDVTNTEKGGVLRCVVTEGKDKGKVRRLVNTPKGVQVVFKHGRTHWTRTVSDLKVV